MDLLSSNFPKLNKAFKAIQPIITAMKAKQALIGTGLLLGVGAITAIALWLKGGGLNGLIDGIKEQFVSPEAREAKKKADKYVQEQTDLIKTSSDFGNQLNTLKEVDYDAQQGDYEDKKDRFKQALVDSGIDEKIVDKIDKKRASTRGLASIRLTGDANTQPTKLQFPFVVSIDEHVQQDAVHSTIFVHRTITDYTISSSATYEMTPMAYTPGQNSKLRHLRLGFTNALTESFKQWGSKDIPVGQVVALLDSGWRCIGNKTEFFKQKDGESVEDATLRDRADEIASEANKIAADYEGDILNKPIERRILGFYKGEDIYNSSKSSNTDSSETKSSNEPSTDNIQTASSENPKNPTDFNQPKGAEAGNGDKSLMDHLKSAGNDLQSGIKEGQQEVKQQQQDKANSAGQSITSKHLDQFMVNTNPKSIQEQEAQSASSNQVNLNTVSGN